MTGHQRREAPSTSRWWQVRVEVLARVIALASLAGVLMGRLGAVWWVFDLGAHFPLYCALASALALPLVRTHRAWVAVALAGLGLSLALLAPLLPWKESRPGDIRVGVFNVLTSNHDRAPAGHWLASQDLDVLCAVEVDRPWTEALGEHMRVAWSIPRRDNFGVAVLIGPDVEVVSTRRLDFAQLPMIEATLRTEVGLLELLVVHTMPPIGGDAAALRNAHLADVTGWLEARSGPAVVCGDLNITRWSPHMAPLLELGEDPRVGAGHLGTWTVHGLLPLGVPIDHVLPRGLRSTRVVAGPNLGSDHLPLVVDLVRGYPSGPD